MRLTSIRSAAAALFLSLAAACGGGSSPPPPPAITVIPAAPGVAVGQSQQFTATVPDIADQSVSWLVQEGSVGGSITPVGLYTAPSAPGTFHVVATSLTDGSRKGTATVYVVPPAACTLETPQPSALPAQVIELGVHTVGEAVQFTVPPGTGSVTLVQQGKEPLGAQSISIKGAPYGNTVIPATIKVNGTPYYDQNIQPPDNPANWGTPNGIGSVYFASAAPWTGTVTVPNTSNALEYVAKNNGVPAGTWSVQVFDYAAGCSRPDCITGDGSTTYPPGKYDLKALLKPGPVAVTGTIDVTFYLVTDTLDAQTAPTNPSILRMYQTLSALFAPAGLTLVSPPAFVDLPPAVKAYYASHGVNDADTSPCGDIPTLLRMSNAGNRMNIFLVKSFTTAGVVGMDGTIPGPASVGGTVASGALVSSASLLFGATTACGGAINLNGCGADFTAYIVAHEAGHFLGLYHPTENNGTLFDPVKDTSMCPCNPCKVGQTANCYSGSGPVPPSAPDVNVDDCTKSTTCGGGENLMFWQLDRLRSTGSLSAQQQSIMRANPLVR